MSYPEQPGQPSPQGGPSPQYPAPSTPQGYPAPPQAPQYGVPSPQTGPPAPPYGAQPGYPSASSAQMPAQPDLYRAPMPAHPAGPGTYAAPTPGKGLAITGLILAFLAPLVGLILSIIAAVKLRKAHASAGIAIAGIIIAAVLLVVETIAIIVGVIAFSNILQMCVELGPGTWHVDGATYTCS